MCKIKKSDKMKQISCCISDNYKLWIFYPSILKLFPSSGNMHKMTVAQVIRFLELLIHGYRVYVLSDLNNNVVGFAMFSNGGSYRYPFAKENDLICGPYFIRPEYRNKGLATNLLKEIIENHELEYNTIYAHIWHTNTTSVNCLKKLDFNIIGRLKISKVIKRCILDTNGKLILMERKI